MMPDIRWKAPVRRCQRSQGVVAQGQHAPGVPGAIARACVGFVWAMAKEGPRTLSRPTDPFRDHVLVGKTVSRDAHGHAKRRSPGVVSPSAACRGPTGPRVPRWRQAPDGGKDGGTQPTESRRIPRRLFLAPPLFMRKGENHDEDLKKSCSRLLTLEVIATPGFSRRYKRSAANP